MLIVLNNLTENTYKLHLIQQKHCNLTRFNQSIPKKIEKNEEHVIEFCASVIFKSPSLMIAYQDQDGRLMKIDLENLIYSGPKIFLEGQGLMGIVETKGSSSDKHFFCSLVIADAIYQ